MTALLKHRYTVDEYIAFDRETEGRYEYFDGEVVCMSGGSLNHNRIVRNMIARLENLLAGGSCEVLPSDMRIKVPAAHPYRYPDIAVFCGEPVIEELQGQELLVNPVLLVEVLSPSTAAYDQGRKFEAYQSIPTFREYVVITQTRPQISQHVRQPNGEWLRNDLVGIKNQIALPSIGCTLTFEQIYRQVKFNPVGDF